MNTFFFKYSADEQTKKRKINEQGTVINDALIEVGKPLYLVVKLITNQMYGEQTLNLLKVLTTIIMGGI